ncbi:MAG: TIM barrel protein [Clostridia bacterium]|nr:TIM barrel protein [Clostridia bacterium]
MKIIKSACTNVLFPESRKSLDGFRRTVETIAEAGFGWMEFYYDGPGRDKIGNIIRDNGLNALYVGVVPHKEKLLHLCNTDEDGRKLAMKQAYECIDEADGLGFKHVMYNSGRTQPDAEAGLKALERSFIEMHEYMSRKNIDIKLMLEPCDSAMDARQHLGPYALSREFAIRMEKHGAPVYLTMDAAHTAEEGEDFVEAVKATKPWIDRIHYANCVVDDSSDPLYGDKHISLNHPRGFFDYAAYRNLNDVFSGMFDTLIVALEGYDPNRDPCEHFLEMDREIFASDAAHAV